MKDGDYMRKKRIGKMEEVLWWLEDGLGFGSVVGRYTYPLWMVRVLEGWVERVFGFRGRDRLGFGQT